MNSGMLASTRLQRERELHVTLGRDFTPVMNSGMFASTLWCSLTTQTYIQFKARFHDYVLKPIWSLLRHALSKVRPTQH